MIRKIYPIIIILLGSFLECYFYAFRFTGDGTPLWISLIISICLTALLTLIATGYKKPIAWIVIIPLSIYSMICTSAGQALDLGAVRESKTIDIVQQNNIQDEINELKTDIAQIDIQIEKTSEQITADTTWARSKYSDAISSAESRYDELISEKRDLQNRLSVLRNSQTTSEKIINEDQTDIYNFYNRLAGLDIIKTQYFLQTALSFFICISAPLGMAILMNRKQQEPTQQAEQPKSKISLNKEKIKLFVLISWAWFRQDKKKNVLVPYENFEKHMQNRKHQGKFADITKDEWDLLFNCLIDNKIVDENGMIMYTGEYMKVVDLLNEKLRGRLS
jgi:hypothetical protein